MTVTEPEITQMYLLLDSHKMIIGDMLLRDSKSIFNRDELQNDLQNTNRVLEQYVQALHNSKKAV